MKKKLIKSEGTRRKFINEGLASGVGWLLGITPVVKESGEMVKMLTPDGKVVEVPAGNIKTKKSKTKNKDILQWRNLTDKNNQQIS
jgi:hypothetical protein